MAGEKRLPLVKLNLPFEGRLFPPGRGSGNHTICVDKRGNTGIGHPNHAPPAFDGTNRAEIIVVPIARGVFPPSIVCDHADKAIFPGQVLSDVGTKHRFKTDNWQYVNRLVGQYKRRARLARAVGAGVAAKLKGVFSQETQILYKGHALEYGY